jgi:hypothetical protein
MPHHLPSIRSTALTGLLLLVIDPGLYSQTFTKITTGGPVAEAGAWRSVNWIDYDRDGDLDLFVTRGLTGGQDNVLFRNDGGPGFSFTRMSGLSISQDNLPSDGSTWADYDNDGYPDAFVVNWYNKNNLLYHNERNGSFTRVLTGPAVTDGGYSETASWGDYDNDGLVDLYVTNSSGPRLNFLYKNMGGGQFVKITAGRQSTDVGTSRGVNWVDYDGDGDLDLFVANESNENEFLYRNMLMETGIDTFQRVSDGPLVSAGGASWSGSWADFDNDGDQDIFVVNWTNQVSRLFVNNGDGTFTPDSADPMASDAGFGATAGWGDFDNDGDLDLIVTHAYSGGTTVNYLYRNLLSETDTAKFERVMTGPVVTDVGYSYGTSWGDFDGDGDLDLFVARTQGENQVNAFYSNDGNSNHWLTFDLRGTASNAAAIGARVRLRSLINGTPVWQLRVVEGQSGYCGQNLQLHFGMGDAVTADSVVIRWPSGSDEVFTGIAADAHLVVVEHDSTPVTPVSPAPGYLNDAPDILLRWNHSLHYPPYRLQVSTDSLFAGGMTIDTLVGGDTAFYARVTSNLTRCYWRVRPDRSIHASMWSAVRYFDNDVQVPDSAAPLSPPDASTNVPLTAALTWRSAARATGYHVRLGADSLFTLTLLDTSIADTTIGTGTIAYLTRYFWDVRPVNFVGSGPASGIRNFTTIIQAPATPALETPPDGGTNLGAPIELSWLAADRAETYQIQVSAESLFIPPKLLDTLLADTTVHLPAVGSFRTYYWRVRSFNAGGQSVYTAFRRFRTVIAPPALLEPPDGASQFSSVRFTWAPSPPAAAYHLQYGPDSTFALIEHEDSTITDTSFSVSSLQTHVRYFWRARTIHPESTSPWSVIRSFVTTLDTFLLPVTASWNLVSLPGNVADREAAGLFPGASTPFYAYESGYATADTLEYGRGYWVRMPSAASIPIPGTKRLLDTIDVLSGWNMIGALSEPVAASSIGVIPEGITASPVFGYDGGFRREDTLRPGAGYWIKTDQPGKLILDASLSFVPRASLRSAAVSDPPPPPPGDPVIPTAQLPDRFGLFQNYPNPFNPATIIRFSNPDDADVRLEVFNALGERVAVLTEGYREAGYHALEWDASPFPSGVYYIRMIAGRFNETKSMLLVK